MAASSGVSMRGQPQVQSKVDVLGGPLAMAAEATVQAEHRLDLAGQIGKMAMRIDRRFLATSDPLIFHQSREMEISIQESSRRNLARIVRYSCMRAMP